MYLEAVKTASDMFHSCSKYHDPASAPVRDGVNSKRSWTNITIHCGV